MNPKNSIYFILLTLSGYTFFASCSAEDRRKEYAEQTGLDRWIDSIMRQDYYWYEDIPATSELNYFDDADDFFDGLLSDDDDSYSTIEDLSETEYSYGLEFKLYELSDTAYAAQILYVLPDSPASDAGLSRGDWITAMDGDSITDDNYTSLYRGDALELSVAQYSNGELGSSNTVQLGIARSLTSDPIYYSKTFTWNGEEIGYLVYTHFTSGTDESDATYSNELLNLSNEFSGISEFILDLRYNSYGTSDCAQLLATILAPSSALGETFCTLKYNDKQSAQTETKTFDTSLISSGTNLNLKTLYVLTSSTTAGPAELLISALQPYMTVIIIGEDTGGKNVGLGTYTNEEYLWTIHPTICMLYNAEEETNLSGFSADYEATEDEDNLNVSLGDTSELLLSTALSVIDGSYSTTTATAITKQTTFKVIANSLNRSNKVKGVVIK